MSTLIRLFVCFLVSILVPAIYADVNPDGSFSHTIPIEIPAGRNGLQPKLALTYNSNGGNGIIGVGWSLSGLPAITRMNFGNGINYGRAGFPADTYVGPEGRLIALGSGTGIYHTETESWSKYEAIGNCGNGPCSWKVTDRNGFVYHYGLTTNSRIIAKDANNNDINFGAVRVWALERVEDLNGNYYEITYKKDAGLLYDNGQYYPEKISYTLGNSVSKNYAISFFYDETGRPDKEISFAQSAYVKTNWRLSKIAVDYQSSCFLIFTCSDRIRSYQAEFEAISNSNQSQLTRWQEYDAANLTLPPKIINWPADSVNYASKPETTLAGTISTDSSNRFLVGDFNGDGKTDMAWLFPYGGNTIVRTSYATTTGYSQWTEWMWGGSISVSDQIATGDFDGDGKTDIVWLFAYNGDTKVRAAISTGISYFARPEVTLGGAILNDPSNRFLIGDFDADGKSDLAWLFPYNGNTIVRTSISTGTSFGSWYEWVWSGAINNTDQIATGDFDGDGKTDLVWLFAYNSNTKVRTAISKGNTFTTWAEATLGGAISNDSSNRFFVSDFNGDGKSDLAWLFPQNGNTYVRTSHCTGVGFLPWTEQALPGSIAANDKIFSPDLNRDGKSDILWLFALNGNSYIRTSLASSSGFSGWSETIWNGSISGDNYVIPLTTTGKTNPDIIWLFAFNGDTKVRTVSPTTSRASLISSISENSAVQSVEYESAIIFAGTVCPTPCTSPDSSSLSYTNGIPNASPRYVVTQVKTTSNMDLDGAAGNDTFTTNYEYYNGRMTMGTISERTSLGFEKIKTIDAATNNYKIDTYRQDKPFHGRPLKTASYLANGSKVSETTFPALAQYYCDETGCNTYNTVPIATPTQPQQIRPKIAAQLSGGESSSTTTTSFENGIAYAAKTEEVLAFDAYGNALSARQTIDGNGATRSTYKFAQYINDTATGRTIGLPFNEKVCLTPAACAANDSNFVSESNTYFDSNATTGVIGSRKLVTKKESYLSTGVGTGIWVPETFTYDALGNVTQKVDAQGITTTIAYETDYRQYPVSVTRSHGSATSLMTYTYDYRFGKKLTETNHDDNLITIYSVDASGFVTGQQTQNGATILAKKSYAHSPFGTSPIWTQECTFYGATFTTTACRKKFTDSLGRVYREEFPELVAGVETQMAVEHRYLPAQNGVCSGATTPTTIIKRDLVSKPKPSSTTTEDFHTSFSSRSFPGEWSEHCFDELNRAKQTRTHDNKTTSSNYQNAGTSATTGLPASGSVACTVNTDVDGVKKRSCTDIGGKPSAVSEAYTSATETTVNYGYDALNRLTSVSSPQGVTTITYVGRSQLQESIIDPVVGTTSYEYYLTPGQGDFTKLKKETRPASAGGTTVTDLEYSAAFGRVSKTTKADAVTTYIYDETDLSYGKGRLTTMAHTVDGYTIQDRYSYNDRGETTNTTRRISHATETLCSNVNAMPCLQTFGSTKDELGRVKTMTYPDGKVSTVNYLPGSTNNVSSLVHDGNTYATYSDYTFDVTPHVGKVTYGNGVEHAYTYNASTGLLNTVTIGKPSIDPYMDIMLTYDSMLNITRIDDSVIPTLTTEYEYDSLRRLTKATWDPAGIGVTTVRDYRFDSYGATNTKGNLLRKGNRRFTYATNKTYPISDEIYDPNTLTWNTNATYTWSANGNLLTKGLFTYSYDSNNMMKQAVEVDGSSAVVGDTKFFYDQSGQRFLKKHTRGGVTIKTWYLGDGIEIREKYIGVTAGTPEGTYDSSQSTKYIYGIDNKKLASITGTVYTAALTVSSSSMYALADGHSSSTVSGIAGKVYYTFYGAYAHTASAARELTAGEWRMIALAFVGLMLLVWLVLTHPLSPSLKKREGSTTSPLPLGERLGVKVSLWQRATALGMLFAFFTVNCGQLPLGVTQGQVDTAISELYTGLPTGTVYYSHNHLGSGNLVTDAAGNEVFRITYDEYGQIDLQKSGKFNPATGLIEHDVEAAKILVTAVKYTGQEYDPETGLYYYNARYYDPQLGVFTTADSEVPEFSDSQSYNRHMYVRGNPIMYNDPTGHFFKAIGKWLSQAWEDTKQFVKKNADTIKAIASVIFNPVAALNGGVSLWAGMNAYSHATTGNWLTADQGWRTFGAGAQAGVVISSSVAVGGYVSGLALPFANTLGIVAGSIVESSMQFAYTGGESEFRVHFGAFSVGDKGFRSMFDQRNTWLDDVGYVIGAAVNFTDFISVLEKASRVSQAQNELSQSAPAKEQAKQGTTSNKHQSPVGNNKSKTATVTQTKTPAQLRQLETLRMQQRVLTSPGRVLVETERAKEIKHISTIPTSPWGDLQCDEIAQTSMRPANDCT